MNTPEDQSPWTITSDQFSHLYSFYHDIVPEGELLSGSRAREFFLLSNLPSHQLHHIWTLSDIDRDGRLNPVEFAVAIHLVQLLLAGLPLPSSLPDELKVFFVSVLRHTLPVAKPHQLEKCRSAFTSFMENDKSGRTCISSTAAEYLLTNSKLSKGHLFHIWMLSDLDADGKLSFTEFAVAMQLVFVAKLSYWLPLSINPADILPEEFFSLARQVEAQAADLPLTDQPAPPSLPRFVYVGEDNPAISKVFKAIPAEQFLNGKFEQFAGNPFQPSSPISNGHLPHLHHGEASPKSSHSSNTSSVRSLVEEREEPVLQQAISVELVEVTPTPEVEDELNQLEEASSKFLQETGGESEVSQQGPTEVEQRFVVDTEMQSAGSKGLPETIRQMSPDQAERNDTVPVIKQDQTPEKTENQTGQTENHTGQTENQAGQTENQAGEAENDPTTDDILAQLADLEAEVMDMLDDTNSFEPPPTPKPAPEPTPPPQAPEPVKEERKPVEEADTGKNIPVIVKTSPPSSSSSSSSSPRRRTSSEVSPEKKKFEPNGSPRRKRSNTTNKRKSQLLEDIDALLGDELANIESMEEAFKSQEGKRKERGEREREELRQMEIKVKENRRKSEERHLESIEVIRQKRLEESKQIEEAWEEEMRKASAIARSSYEEQMSKLQLVENETIHGLEEEFAALLEHERESMKGAREIRAQRQKEEEEERIERMRRRMEEKKEVTIEEWIAMMEQNKLKEMTSEEREKYEARKRVWLEKRREKEERMRIEEEEKLRLAKERMNFEYRSYCQAEKEVKDSRLTAEQLQQLTEEQQQKEAEERKMRSEQARRRSTERRYRELEEAKPKAKSALAARWEQSVQTRNPRDVRSTVLTGIQTRGSTISDREKERLAKHVG